MSIPNASLCVCARARCEYLKLYFVILKYVIQCYLPFLSYSSYCSDETPSKSDSREKGFLLAHTWRYSSAWRENPGWQELEGLLARIKPVLRMQSKMSASCS